MRARRVLLTARHRLEAPARVEPRLLLRKHSRGAAAAGSTDVLGRRAAAGTALQEVLLVEADGDQ
eukprot:2681799-Prymnesium_polylepis.2